MPHSTQYNGPGSAFARWLLRLFGWSLLFNGLPAPRGVIIVYPHTSNWDFVVGILAKWGMGLHVRFWAKDSLFKGFTGATLGRFMRSWGGVPVNRGASQGLITSTVEQMRTADQFWLVLAPEGTRSYIDHWKSGFYHVAVQAQVPLGLASMDFARKEIRVTQFIDLTGDAQTDLTTIAQYYQTITAAKPANAAPIRFKS